MATNRKAFLDMIAFSEGTSAIGRNDGYDVLVGSTQSRMSRIDDLARHPRITVQLNDKLWSSAAGRYQFIWPTWMGLQAKLKLPDFGRNSQDAAALELVRQRGALSLVDQGRITDAIIACAPVWASLPGAGYGQFEHTFDRLLQAYKAAGGSVA